VRADGLTSHQACYGTGYRGEILPFGETALFKAPASHTRQATAKDLQAKGDSTMVKGIWVGKNAESDDHVFLTAGGWHRARTVRRLEPAKRADPAILQLCKTLPWEPRSARPLEALAKQAPPRLPLTQEEAQAQRPNQSANELGATSVQESVNELGATNVKDSANEPGATDAKPAWGAAAGSAEAGSRRGSIARTPQPPTAPSAVPAATPNDGADAEMGVEAPAFEGADDGPAKRARVVAAVCLDDPIDYSLLDEKGTEVLTRCSELNHAAELKG